MKNFLVILIVAFLLIFSAVKSDAVPVFLTLTNPGFETGDFTGWETYNDVPQWEEGSDPEVLDQRPAHPDNMYTAFTFQGVIRVGTSGASGFYQDNIPMPVADDVRWSFWVHPDAVWCKSHPPISGFISITDDTGESIVWDIYFNSSGFHFEDTIPIGWTMESSIDYWSIFGSKSYMVTTSNLKNDFPDAQTLKVDFHGYQEAPDQMSQILMIVDNIPPIPEPSTLILFGSGLVGLLGFARKRIFKKT